MSCMADVHEVQEANNKSKFHRQMKTCWGVINIMGEKSEEMIFTVIISKSCCQMGRKTKRSGCYIQSKMATMKVTLNHCALSG